MDNSNEGENEDSSSHLLYTWQGGNIEFYPTLHSKQVAKVSFGSEHTAILTRNHELYVEGGNLYGQLGTGSAGGAAKTPILVEKLKDALVIDVACGSNHTAAILDDGTVCCWGDGSHGQCGNSFAETVTEPTPVALEEQGASCEHGVTGQGRILSAFQISCGDIHTMAISTDYELWTWGSGVQLGLGNLKETCKPMKVEFLCGKKVLSVSCGASHTVTLVERSNRKSSDNLKLKVHNDKPSTCALCHKEVYSCKEEQDMCIISDEHKCPLGLELRDDQSKSDDNLSGDDNPESQSKFGGISLKQSKTSIFNAKEAKEFLSKRLSDGENETPRSGLGELGSNIGAFLSNVPFRSVTDRVVANVQTTIDKFRFVSAENVPEIESMTESFSDNSISDSGSEKLTYKSHDESLETVAALVDSSNKIDIIDAKTESNICDNSNTQPLQSPQEQNVVVKDSKAQDTLEDKTKQGNEKVSNDVIKDVKSNFTIGVDGDESSSDEDDGKEEEISTQTAPIRKGANTMETSFSSDNLKDMLPDHFKAGSHANSKRFSVHRVHSLGALVDPRYSLTLFNKQGSKMPACRVSLDTEVWSWGTNKSGQLGVGDMLERIQPSCVNYLSNRRVVKIICGANHSLALTSTGQVFSWGSNKHGQLGQSNNTVAPSKIKLISSQFIWDVATGRNHTLLVADMGPQPEIYYCGKQQTGSPIKSGRTCQPIRLTDFRRKAGWIRQAFAGGDRCGCIVDKTIDSLSATLYEVAASERNFHYQLSLMTAGICKPILLSEAFIGMESTTYGMSMKILLESFINLTTNIGINSVELTRTIQGLESMENISMLGSHEEFLSLFEHYSKSFCDSLAVCGFDNISKITIPLFEKSQEVIKELSEMTKVEVATDATKMLCRLLQIPLQRLGTYSRLTTKLTNALPENSELKTIYEGVSRMWDEIKGDIKDDRTMADSTRKFWDSCSPKLMDVLKLPNRRLIRDSRSHSLSLLNAGRFSSHWFLLFNDAFVHAQYASHQNFPLATVWTETVKESESSGLYQFRLVTPEETLTLNAPSASEKAEWVLKINQAILAVIMEKKSLRSQTKMDTRGSRVSMYQGSLRKQSSSSLFTLPISRQACHVFYRIPELKGGKYEGMWSLGKPHGQGEMTFLDGSVYSGKFKLGQFNGQGKLTVPKANGAFEIHEGLWKEGMKQGLGKVSYENGDIYEGYCKGNLRHGHGVFKQGQIKSSQATIYIGEWVNDKRCGYGVMDDVMDGEKYMGMWQDDVKHGKGIIVTLDGIYYEGNFNYGKMTGVGLMIMNDDTCYEGDFYDKNQPYGKGTLTMPNGDSILGQFSGKLIHGLKVNGTFRKRGHFSTVVEKRTSFHSSNNAFKSFGKFSVAPDNKWEDIFRYCRTLLFSTPDVSTVDVKKAWEVIAIRISAGKKSASQERRPSAGDSLDILESIPPYNTGNLTVQRYRAIKTYLSKAFDTHYHPLGHLMEGLVDVYRATYVGVGANARLLSHAVGEVKSFVARIYDIIRKLFPDLPQESSPVQIFGELPNDKDSVDEEEEEVISASGLLHPILLPRVYPVLFTLYALHCEQEDDKYTERMTRWNRQADIALMSYLGMDEKFWLLDEYTSGHERFSTIRDKCFLDPIEKLQQISTTFCPSDKLDVIRRAFNGINKAVQTGVGKGHMWSMDDLFPVFQYVVIRARIQHLGAEICFIQDLMEHHLEFGELGIMFTTLKACYFQIQHEKING